MADIIYQNTTDIRFYSSEDIIWMRNKPSVETLEVIDIDNNSATGVGEILELGGENSLRRGFCYKEGSVGDPTIDDNVVYDDGDFGVGEFSKLISGLLNGAVYQVRAYAINSAGVGYGITIYFITEELLQETLVLSDRVVAVLFTSVAKIFRDSVLPEKVREVIGESRVKQIILSERVRQVTCTPVDLQEDDDMLEFSPKQAYEEYYVVFNFARVITPLTLIESTVVTAEDADGEDVTATFTDESKLVVVGNKVYVWVRGGTEQVYKITCKIVMDNGEKFEQDAQLEVTEV